MRWSVMLNVIRWERWLEGGLLDAGAFRGKYKAIVDVMERVRMFVDGLVITRSWLFGRLTCEGIAKVGSFGSLMSE